MTDTLIEARGVSAGYGTMAVVRELDIRVDAGEVVALIGANGAGKTTTLLTLAGELTPLQGEVHFLGKATKAPMHARCREGLGYVTEERSVMMDMSVAENLKLAAVPPTVDRVFSHTGMGVLFERHPDRASAIAAAGG